MSNKRGKAVESNSSRPTETTTDNFFIDKFLSSDSKSYNVRWCTSVMDSTSSNKIKPLKRSRSLSSLGDVSNSETLNSKSQSFTDLSVFQSGESTIVNITNKNAVKRKQMHSVSFSEPPTETDTNRNESTPNPNNKSGNQQQNIPTKFANFEISKNMINSKLFEKVLYKFVLTQKQLAKSQEENIFLKKAYQQISAEKIGLESRLNSLKATEELQKILDDERKRFNRDSAEYIKRAEQAEKRKKEAEEHLKEQIEQNDILIRQIEEKQEKLEMLSDPEARKADSKVLNVDTRNAGRQIEMIDRQNTVPKTVV